ncbi:four-carbon acid sugar kinase family protein [Azospirillum sp. YIM B02556]|uniref:Four-carbon acid sugar kinase family protein n=1 Tax=Azospirillum endophyticum TaxID=2800326 RepID=A0ABS1F6Q4_9PROT|nr:four-carbon acid sugar kinase family protein [Azospirillum endophyticum]MBK1839092.1 four-carbon acid sugar kinase family protein [Azospirillum endophyticum]
MAATPRLGWYGDDFTGATDTLAALAKAGQRALLFLDVPDVARLGEAGPLDAVGIAGAARSMAPDAMRAELEPVGRFFAALGVAVMHYKCCSTFDSAPGVGSIGEAVRTLAPHFRNRFRPVVGGQPNIGRYCLFSTLFAAAGTGGAVHRIDRHPTMSVHPVTPMAEADLRRHLAAQGLEGMAALHFPDYGLDGDVLDGQLERLLADGPSALLLDVARAEDLATVGRLIWERAGREPLLAVGPSSVAQALVAHWNAGSATADEVALAAADSPVFLMAGSLSPVTRRQIEAAASYTRIQADAAALCGDPGYAETLLGEVAASLAAGRHTLVWTAPADAGTADTAQAGRVAAATADFVAAMLRRVALRRVGIAGGDTSSLAVRALGCWGLSYRCTLAPGVTVSRTHADDPAVDGLELMLKGGQMGGEDLFERLLG